MCRFSLGHYRIYDRYDYFEERKQALAKVATLIAPMIDSKSTGSMHDSIDGE